MKQSSRAWILLTLGILLCASLLVAKTPEVKAIDQARLAPGANAPNAVVKQNNQSTSSRPVIIEEGFETGSIPTGWSQEYVSGTSDWTYQAGGNSGNPETAHSGEYNALLYVGNTNGDATRLITPQFNITQGAVLTFWHTQPLWSSDQDELTLLYRNTPNGVWTEIQTWTESITDWTEEVITLPNASTTYQIAFEGLAIFGYGIGIDDVIVTGDPGEVGSIEGTVTLDGGNGVVTEVEVEVGGMVLHPDQNGDYSIEIAVGTYDVTATLFGYGDAVVNDVVVEADQATSDVDMTLVPNPFVTVTGRCVGSDYPDVGLANVQVDLSGYDTYQAFTNADGYFTIGGVWTGHTYQITARVNGYDIYTGEAIVGDTDVDLGNIILPEIASPPYDLIATQNAEGTIANLVWRQPTGSLETFYNFDDDDCDFVSNDGNGWQWGVDTEYGSHSEPNIWGTALNSVYENSANWILDSPEIVIGSDQFVLNFWQRYDSEGTDEYTYDAGNVKISTDGGDTWTVIEPVGGYPSPAAHANNVAIPGEPCYFGSTEGWVLATFELAEYQGEEAMFRWQFGTDGSVNTYDGWFIDDVRVGMPEERFALQQDNDHLRWVTNVPNRTNRSIEGYSVYRMLLGEEDIEENWVLVNGDVADTTYADDTWADVATEIYKYAVRANYTNDVFSAATISDWLAKNYYTTCTVNVESATGDPIVGTIVSLTCQETDPDGEYPEYEYVLGEDESSAYFPMVWLGSYEVVVSLEGAEPVVEIHNITSPTTIDITLTELTPPVSGLTATVNGDDVSLMWRPPSPSHEFNFDDDDGEFISNDTAGWAWGEDANGSHSEPNVWGTMLNSNYVINANWALDSPEISISGNSVLTFWHFYDTEGTEEYSYDAGNVKISTDGGDTWTVIEPEGGYPSPAAHANNAAIPGEPCYFGNSGGWIQATFDLEEYAGERAMFRWHFGTDGSIVTYDGWYIDDVYIGAPQSNRAADNNVTRRTNRSLEGFTLYRNSTMIDDSLEPDDTTYVDMDLADGVYTYDLVANYTTGDSDPESVTVQVYPVNIEGYVNTSDDPDNGLNGALVVLENEEFYFETTTVNGDFNIVDVNGMQTYTLTITYESDDVFYEDYETEVVVTDQDIDLNTITLIEQTPPPGTVIATENTAHTQVDLIWGTPGSSTPTEFRWDDGNPTGQLGYPSGGADVRLGAAHFHEAQIDEITWLLTEEGGPHAAIDLYIYGLDATGMPDGTDELFSVTGVANTDTEWNTFVLPEPVEAPNGFFVCANYASGFLGLGTDDGVDEPWELVPGTQFVTNSVGTNAWEDLAGSDFPYNFTIRAIGLDFGEIEYRGEYVARNQNSKNGSAEGLVWIGGCNIETNKTRNTVAAHKEINNVTTNTRNRSLEGYQVYRLDVEDINDPSQWEHLTEDGLVTDTTYVDDEWEDLASAVYVWGVRAAYTNENYSDFSFSNEIPHSMTTQVTVVVTTNTDETPQGAILTMENIDGNDEHVYEAIVPNGGTVTFPAVWLGLYTMTCELDGYEEYVENNVVVEDLQGEDFEVELEEALIAVVDGFGEVDGNDIILSWSPAGEGGADAFTEDFESGALPANWEINGISTDENGPIPGYFTVTDYSSDTVIPFDTYHAGLWWTEAAQDEWLITPEFTCGSESMITWDCVCYRGSTYNDHYYLKVSTDGGSNWDILWDATELTGEWNYYYEDYTVDLSDYAGEDITLAWNCVDGDSQGLWYVFFVDNIAVTNGEDVIHFDGSDLVNESRVNKGVKEVARTCDRSLLGYKITRNGTTIVEQQTETEYIDVNLPGGTWTYMIYAVYTTGEAEPFPLGPFVGTNGGYVNEYVTGLSGNYPNPFNPETEIKFSLSNASKVSIDIYNIKGQKVKSLVNDKYDAGDHSAVWKGTDDNNRKVGSGIYFYKMKSGRYTATKKMILLK